MNSPDTLKSSPIQQFNLAPRGHIGFFDGIKGTLCVWVYLYHASVMAGLYTSLIPAGAVAVDLFMFISGFLIAYTLSIATSNKNKLSLNMIITFFTRRFFRIAPVYYFMLIFAFLFYTDLIYFQNEADTAFPASWMQDLGNDPSIRSVTPLNIIMHMTFLFGLNPHYASNMAIPDWMVSLDMQYYAIAPFLLIAFRKYGLAPVVIGLAIINFLALRYIGLYLTPNVGGLWPQPSFIIFKLNCFSIGMLLAFYFVDEKFNKAEIICLMVVLICLEKSFIFSVIIMLCFVFLKINEVGSGYFAKTTQFLFKICQLKLVKFFGNISYSVYLIHPLVLLPIMHFLLKSTYYTTSSPYMRFLILSGLAAGIVIPASYLLHITIERWGQTLARQICKWIVTKDKPLAVAG